MKLKEGFALRNVCGEYAVVATGLKNLNFNKVLHLNGSAAFLWEKFYGQEFTAADMVASLLEKYDGVDEATAAADVDKLVDSLRKAEVLDD